MKTGGSTAGLKHNRKKIIIIKHNRMKGQRTRWVMPKRTDR